MVATSIIMLAGVGGGPAAGRASCRFHLESAGPRFDGHLDLTHTAFLAGGDLLDVCPIANKGNDVVRISSRTWTLAQIEDLAVLIAAGSTAANAAVALRRSITVVRAKARNLGTPFQIIAEDRRRLKPSESFIYAPSRFRATHEV